MKYKPVIVTGKGGLEVLQVVEEELRLPSAGEARTKTLASHVSAPDIEGRYGRSPFVVKPPFTPGYAVIGDVDAVGEGVDKAKVGERIGALTAYGGYAEHLYWDARQLIPVPASLDPGEAVPFILNYIVAYLAMHRWAKVKRGDAVLIVGASRGLSRRINAGRYPCIH